MQNENNRESSKRVNMSNRIDTGLILRSLFIGSLTVTACSPSTDTDTAAKPVMKIAEPQREALDKAKATSQALEDATVQQQKAIEQASE